MPYLASGKTNLKKLREELQQVSEISNLFGSFAAVELDGGQTMPKSPAQVALEAALREIFAVEHRLPISANFFLLGGDSLAAIKLVGATRKSGYEISVGQIYHYPRLEDLASVAVPVSNVSTTIARKQHQVTKGLRMPLEDDNAENQVARVPKSFSLMEATDRESILQLVSSKCQTTTEMILDIYPCTSLQESLMISAEKSPGAYFHQEVFRLAEKTAVPKLVACLKALCAHHDILRTRIVHDETYRSLQIVVNESVEVPHVEQDLTSFLRKDLSNIPSYGEKLSRWAVVAHGQSNYLVLSQHHAVFDGWSRQLLPTEIRHRYSGEGSPITPQIKFSCFVLNVVETNKSSEAKHYWEQYLAGLEPKSIPQLKHSFAFKANQQQALIMPLPPSATHSLAARAEGAWAIVLGRYSESEDVTFGAVRSGRMAPVDGLDTIFGPTTVTFPRRLRPIRDQNIHQYLQCVSTTIAETLPWEQYSHQNIRKLNEGARRACRYNSIIVVQMQSSYADGQEKMF